MRKELIALKNIECCLGESSSLIDYSLTVFEGEIVYLQGESGSGKIAIEKTLIGKEKPTAGRIYVEEEYCQEYSDAIAMQNGIYTIGIRSPMVNQLPLYENMEGIKKARHLFSVFHRSKAKASTAKLLEELSIDRDPELPARDYTFYEELLLSTAKVCLQGGKLIILDCVHLGFANQDARKIVPWMKKMKREQGVSFLIISEKPNPFLDAADRVQIVSHGRDLMEWTISTQVIRYLMNPNPGEESGSGNAKTMQRGKSQKASGILGFVDEDNDFVCSCEFFGRLQKRNEVFWNTYVQAPAPVANHGFDAKSVFIPRDSAFMLFNNLSIDDNLILCIRDRLSIGRTGVIANARKELVVREFRNRIGLKDEICWVGQLTVLQKKILSIERWILARPDMIFLDEPFWAMDRLESEALEEYLIRALDREMSFVIGSRRHEGKLSQTFSWFTVREGKII